MLSETKTTTVRLPPELRERIDQARGDIPRERWVRRALENALTTNADPRGTDRASRALPAGDVMHDVKRATYDAKVREMQEGTPLPKIAPRRTP
jgi:predicted DNA-binding protein